MLMVLLVTWELLEHLALLEAPDNRGSRGQQVPRVLKVSTGNQDNRVQMEPQVRLVPQDQTVNQDRMVSKDQ